MRTIFVLVSLVTLGFLASCTTNQSSDVHAHANTPSDVQYPTSQKDTQATKFCEDKGGEAVVEEGSEWIEMAYCLIDGKKVDAWKFMSDETSKDEWADTSSATIGADETESTLDN